MPPALKTILLLSLSTLFITFACYAPLRELAHGRRIIAALISWGIGLFEYLLQVPANRIGQTVMTVAEL